MRSSLALDPALAILAELNCGESYGSALSSVLGISPGTMYPALHSLERDGFATARNEVPVAGKRGRPRIYYRITEAGRAELAAIAARLAR